MMIDQQPTAERNQQTDHYESSTDSGAKYDKSIAEVYEEKNIGDLKTSFAAVMCFICSILLSVFLKTPYASYIPIILIAILQWYRSFPTKVRSYYGLCRLILYILLISLWIVFIFRVIIQGCGFLLGYHDLPLKKVQHLFPYAFILTSFVRQKQDMDLHDKRRYIIHILYDIPAFLIVIAFKLVDYPLNALCSEITSHCYLGCLPIPSDVETLNKKGIKYVVNLCAEYNGPRKTYKKYNMKQLHIPTVDSTAPSLKSIETAIKFMNEAFTKDEKVFVHCKAGMGRSATIVLCHLVANEKMLPKDAMTLLKEKRPEITNSIFDYASVKLFFASLAKNKQI